MSRRPPLDDRELLRLLDVEHFLELKPDAENREETERIIEQLREKLRESK